MNKIKVLMVVPDRMVMGGIASVVNGYRDYGIGDEYEVTFVESYVNGSKLVKLKKALGAYRIFRKALKKTDFDLVHIHSSFGPSFTRKMPFINMAFRKKIPIVNHIHGAEFEDFYPNASESKKRLIKKIYNRCNLFLVLSAEWKEKISTIVPENKIEIIENYCMVPDISSVENSENILFLGEIGERKGCFDIPKILKQVENSVGEESKALKIVMGGNGDTEPIVSEAEILKLKADFSFPGWIRGRDKDRLIRESGIFLFPSYNEGMPMAVLEAMAYGLAVVTTNVGGIPKLIEDGVTGYICTPGDIDIMSERITKLITNQELRNRIGQQAREFVSENYSFEAHINKIRDAYGKCLRNSKETM